MIAEIALAAVTIAGIILLLWYRSSERRVGNTDEQPTNSLRAMAHTRSVCTNLEATSKNEALADANYQIGPYSHISNVIDQLLDHGIADFAIHAGPMEFEDHIPPGISIYGKSDGAGHVFTANIPDDLHDHFSPHIEKIIALGLKNGLQQSARDQTTLAHWEDWGYDFSHHDKAMIVDFAETVLSDYLKPPAGLEYEFEWEILSSTDVKQEEHA